MQEDGPSSARRYLWLGLLAVVLIYVVALPTAVVHQMVTCGGDGGSPYAAPASPRGKLCETGLIVPALLLVAPGLAAGGGLMAWRRGQSRPLAVGATAGTVVLLLGVLVPALLSKDCSGRPESMTAEEFQEYQQTDCGHY